MAVTAKRIRARTFSGKFREKEHVGAFCTCKATQSPPMLAPGPPANQGRSDDPWGEAGGDGPPPAGHTGQSTVPLGWCVSKNAEVRPGAANIRSLTRGGAGEGRGTEHDTRSSSIHMELSLILNSWYCPHFADQKTEPQGTKCLARQEQGGSLIPTLNPELTRLPVTFSTFSQFTGLTKEHCERP